MKKIMIGTLLFLLLTATVGQCAEWVLVSNTKMGMTYIDTGTIKHDGNLARAWFKGVLSKVGKDKITSYEAYYEFDCKEEKDRELQATAYYSDGSVTTFSDKKWEYVLPDTVGEAEYKAVCK